VEVTYAAISTIIEPIRLEATVSIAMAKKKAESARSPLNKERKGPGFRTIGIRVSDTYAEWLNEAAAHERITVAAFLDRAATIYAKQVGFDKEPPRRID
jgi:hypothetical protein